MARADMRALHLRRDPAAGLALHAEPFQRIVGIRQPDPARQFQHSEIDVAAARGAAFEINIWMGADQIAILVVDSVFSEPVSV